MAKGERRGVNQGLPEPEGGTDTAPQAWGRPFSQRNFAQRNLSQLYLVAFLVLLWFLLERLWLALDRSIPAWDQADYLNGVMNYGRILVGDAVGTSPRFSAAWWAEFWQLSPKIPPLSYVLTVPLLEIVGRGADQALLIQSLYGLVLVASVYGLGVMLLGQTVALWAVVLVMLLPALVRLRLEFLLDFPVAAMVVLVLWLLTLWRQERRRDRTWVLAIATGLALGAALLTKQTALQFLLVPFLWTGGIALGQRHWERLAQGVLMAVLALQVCRPWLTANWLLMLTSSKRATLDSALKEGDPSLLSLDAWLYYLRQLPAQVTWPILLLGGLGLVYGGWIYRGWAASQPGTQVQGLRRGTGTAMRDRSAGGRLWASGMAVHPLRWLGVFLVGTYGLCSLNPNKDGRYSVPWLPVLALVLAYGLVQWPRRVRWLGVGVAFGAVLVQMFPLGGEAIARYLSPAGAFHPEIQPQWPHTEIVKTMVEAEPFWQSTLGVLPSTPGLNQHNLSWAGALADFQVFGRQVGVRSQDVAADERSLDWFLLKTGDQGSIPASQPQMVQAVTQDPAMQPQGRWPLPDGSDALLYHRQTPALQIRRSPWPGAGGTQVRLVDVDVPARIPPGQPTAVTYQWQGPLAALRDGLVLLTWEGEPKALTPALRPIWLHDHGLGLGFLRQPDSIPAETVMLLQERLAMLPRATVGRYRLRAHYLNRRTGETYPIEGPPVWVMVDGAAPLGPAPELDWITQLQQWSAQLPAGPQALGLAFEQVARVNQYDPNQDYLEQAIAAFRQRLEGAAPGPASSPTKEQLPWLYSLALAQVLDRDAPGAIASFEQIATLDPDNPYAHAYLAFVQLYALHPYAAQRSLEPALRLAPHLPELQLLQGIAQVMGGNLLKLVSLIQLVRQL